MVKVRGEFQGWWGSVFLVLVLLGAVGCPPPGRGVRSAGVRGERVCVLVPAERNSAEAVAALGLLREVFPEAVYRGMPAFEEAVALCLAEGRTLVVPCVDAVPMEVWEGLEEYLAAGGKALFWGREPFARRMRADEGGGYVDVDVSRERRMEGAVEIEGVSDVQLWRPRAPDGGEPPLVRVSRASHGYRRGVEVSLSDFRREQMFHSPDWPSLSLSRDAALCFYAKGGEETTRLVVRLVDAEGRRWARAVLLEPSWRGYLLPLAAFEREDAPSVVRRRTGAPAGRGGIARMSVGLDNRLAPQPPGKHVFAISDVRLARGVPFSEYAGWPRLAPLSPPFLHERTFADYVRVLPEDEEMAVERVLFDSPVGGKYVVCRKRGGVLRMVPLGVGYDREDGVATGWPAALFAGPGTEGDGTLWGWVGLGTDEGSRALSGLLLARAADRLDQEVLFTGKPRVRTKVGGNDVIEAEVAWRAPRSDQDRIRVVGELLAADGRRLRRVVAAPGSGEAFGERGRVSHVMLGRAPRVTGRSQEFRVRVALEDVREQERLYDEEVLHLYVKGEEPGGGLSWLRCSGSRFLAERYALFVMGVRYAPRAWQWLPEHQRDDWLTPRFFDARLVREELELLARMEVNAIVIRYGEREQAEGVSLLIHEAERLGMRVGIEMPALSPWRPDLELAAELIETARLTERPAAFALFFEQEHRLGTEEERRELDPAWRAWLLEQYGSLERARRLLGRPVWEDAEGLLGGPSQEDIEGDPRHSVATAVYRRFVEDYLSRQYGHLVRFVRSLGARQLISVYTPPLSEAARYPYDVLAGAAHFDFLSLSAAGVTGPLEDVLELGFLSVYARGGRGTVRPVVWTDYGVCVGPQPTEVDLANQRRVFEQMFDLLNVTASAGGIASAFSAPREPGGVDEGLVSGVGHPRPVCGSFERHARRLRMGMVYPATWRGRLFARSANPRGLAGLFDEWRGVYGEELARQECQEIRPVGFGKHTTDMPMHTVGGVPFSDPAPLECANAEWGAVWVNGRPVLREPGAPLKLEWGDQVRLELINTGVVSWVPSRRDQTGVVWVKAWRPEGGERLLNVSVVAPGAREYIEWRASETGTWRFRPSIFGVGDFGEQLVLRVGQAD